MLELVKTSGVWPQGLLDAYIAMIPKAGDYYTPWSTAPQCAPGCAQAVGFPSAWTSRGSGCRGWLPKSVFSLGNGLSSVEAWFSTALEVEEVLSGSVGNICTSCSLMSSSLFDMVDRSILDCALGGLGLPDWFRRAYFLFS